MVQRRTIGAGDDEVATELRRVDADMAAYLIVELDHTITHPKADDCLPPFGAA